MLLGTEISLSQSDFVLDVVPAPLPKNGAEPPPQFSAHVYCGQTAGWIKMALGMEVGLGPRYIVLDGHPATLPKRGAEPPPHVRPFLLWPNGWMHQDDTLYGCRPQPRRLCVRWGPSPLSPKRGGATYISAHVCCSQTAAWIKMPLGMEVGDGLCVIVLDGDPAPLR